MVPGNLSWPYLEHEPRDEHKIYDMVCGPNNLMVGSHAEVGYVWICGGAPPSESSGLNNSELSTLEFRQ